MRIDKLSTKFQQALADAQSVALGLDNGFIEPQHVLLALIDQDDGGTKSLLARASVRVPGLAQALHKSIENLPKVSSNSSTRGPYSGGGATHRRSAHYCWPCASPCSCLATT